MQLSMFKILRIAAGTASVLSLAFFGATAQAATMSVASGVVVIKPGDVVTVTALLSADGQVINAVEGTLIYSSDLLRLESLRDGASCVTFWITRPKAGTPGKVPFAGITPGGYTGSAGMLFSATFRAVTAGQAHLALSGARALLDDGHGTAAALALRPLDVTIHAAETPPVTRVIVEDRTPPETFTPRVVQEPSVFDGKWFIAFGAQDKESGIDHYEVREIPPGLLPGQPAWSSATSPYPLKDQALQSEIEVRAVDREGNVRTEKILPQQPLPWYLQKPFQISALILALLAVALLFLFMRRRSVRDVPR